MLRLPPIAQLADPSAEKEKGSPRDEADVLRLCMHLNGEVETRVEDFETIRKRKALKIKEAARLRGEEDDNEISSLLPEVKGPRIRRRQQPLSSKTGKLVIKTGHIVRLPPEFCSTGGDEVHEVAPVSPARQNISHTGSWLDHRAFSGTNDVYYGGSKREAHVKEFGSGKGQLTEGDLFFLRHCKDTLKKRFNNNLHTVWRKFHANRNEVVTLNEFVRAASGLFKVYESRLLFRLLDAQNDGNVTFNKMQSLIEAA